MQLGGRGMVDVLSFIVIVVVRMVDPIQAVLAAIAAGIAISQPTRGRAWAVVATGGAVITVAFVALSNAISERSGSRGPGGLQLLGMIASPGFEAALLYLAFQAFGWGKKKVPD
jgi:hypothetical protein